MLTSLHRLRLALCLLAAPCSIAFSSPSQAAAETPIRLDLPAVLQIAQDANAGLAAARQNIDAARAATRTARALPNPELEFTAGRVAARVPGPQAGGAQSLWLTQRLEYPSQRLARSQAADAGVDLAQAEFSRYQADVSAQLKLAFYDALRRDAELKSARDDLALLEQIRTRVELRVRLGESARYELIKADTEVLAAQKAVAALALKAQQARVALRRIAGSGLPESFELAGDLAHQPSVAPVSGKEQLTADLAGGPDMARAKAELRQASYQLEHERSLRLPSLALKAGMDQDPEIRNQRIGLILSIPLFDRREGNIGQAVARQAQARLALDHSQHSLTQALDVAYQQYQIAHTQVTALESSILRQAETALKVAEAAYRYGERGILDYLDAQRVFRTARNELIAARYELQAAAIEIDRLRAASSN